jgi:hypothetical protein
MNGQKVVGRRKAPRTPTEFHAIGAQLDRELSVVKPFTRKRGFVFKARNWEELAAWELQRQLQEHRQRGNE